MASSKCNFCGKSQEDVQKLIAGPQVYICDECIDLCNEILSEENKSKSVSSGKGVNEIPTPSEIKIRLDEYIIGQDKAKKSMAVAVHNHYKRINMSSHPSKKNDVEVEKKQFIAYRSDRLGKNPFGSNYCPYFKCALLLWRMPQL